MKQLSLRLEDELYKALRLKSERENISISEAFRECLEFGLKNFRVEEETLKTATKLHTPLLRRTAMYSLFIYCLLEEYIKTTSGNGAQICTSAEAKAEKLTLSTFEKIYKEESK